MTDHAASGVPARSAVVLTMVAGIPTVDADPVDHPGWNGSGLCGGCAHNRDVHRLAGLCMVTGCECDQWEVL